jgi:hypothetical protein
MRIRLSAFILAVALASSPAGAEAFNREGYKMGPAIEFLVTRDRKAVDISKKEEAEALALYAIAFGEKLSGQWPEKLPAGFGKSAYKKMLLIMGTQHARETGLVYVAGMGSTDALVFASRFDRNSDAAKRVIEAVVLLVGKE